MFLNHKRCRALPFLCFNEGKEVEGVVEGTLGPTHLHNREGCRCGSSTTTAILADTTRGMRNVVVSSNTVTGEEVNIDGGGSGWGDGGGGGSKEITTLLLSLSDSIVTVDLLHTVYCLNLILNHLTGVPNTRVRRGGIVVVVVVLLVVVLDGGGMGGGGGGTGGVLVVVVVVTSSNSQ